MNTTGRSESRISQLGAEFQALLYVHKILDFLLVRRTSLGDEMRDRPIQRGLVAVPNDRLSEQLVWEPPKLGMQPNWVDSQGSRERSPDPGRSLGTPILILIMEPEPSIKFSFDPAGMVGELARHEFWHNQMDGIRPCVHQLQEFGGYPDLFREPGAGGVRPREPVGSEPVGSGAGGVGAGGVRPSFKLT